MKKLDNRSRQTNGFTKKVNKNSLLNYVWVACMVLNFRTVYFSSIKYGWLEDLVIFTSSICLLLSFCGKVKKRIFKALIFSVIFFIVYFSIFYYSHVFRSSAYLKFAVYIIVTIAYSIIHRDEFVDILKYYTNITLIIAVVSLLFWLFGSLLHFIQPTGTIMYGWTGGNGYKSINSYYDIYFEPQTQLFLGFGRVIRNTAFFTESPMLSFVFSLALLFEFFLNDDSSKVRKVILVIAIISTISSAGMIMLVLCYGARIIQYRVRSNSGRLIKTLIVPVVIMMAVIVVISFVTNKLEAASGIARIDDIRAGYSAFRESPVIGNGYGNTDSYQKYMSSFRIMNKGFSNSIFQILAYGGLYLFLPYLLSVIVTIKNIIKHKDLDELTFYLLFLSMFSITIVPFQMLTIYVFSGFVQYSQCCHSMPDRRV